MSYQLHITSTAEHDIMRAVVMQILTASESSFLISFFLSFFPIVRKKERKVKRCRHKCFVDLKKRPEI